MSQIIDSALGLHKNCVDLAQIKPIAGKEAIRYMDYFTVREKRKSMTANDESYTTQTMVQKKTTLTEGGNRDDGDTESSVSCLGNSTPAYICWP